MTEINYSELDPKVIPMIRYFNEHGLPTWMSCQGHNRLNMSMFWISFHPSVTMKDIVEFQRNHLNEMGNFISNGNFCKRFYYCDDEGVVTELQYCAATTEAADDDLQRWLALDGGRRICKGAYCNPIPGIIILEEETP